MSRAQSNSNVYLTKKAYDYALAILAFLIPLVHQGLPLLIIVAAVFGLFYFVKAYQRLGKRKRDYIFLPYNILKDSFSNMVQNKNTHLVMVLFFAYYWISYFYSEDKETGLERLILKSSFLYFPIIFSLTKWDKTKLIRVFNYFTLGCLVNLILSYVFAFLKNDYLFEIKEFTYVNLSYTFHPSYVAMYVNCAIIFNAILLFYSDFKESVANQILRWCVLIAFSLFVIMLSSKAGIIGWAIALGTILLYLLFVRRKVFQTLVIGVFFAGFFFITYNSVSIVGNRIQSMAKSIEKDVDKNNSGNSNSTQSRMGIWITAMEVIQKNPIFGVGIGDGKNELQKEFVRKEQTKFYTEGFNSHNQILDTGLAIGALGVVLLGLILVLGCINYGSSTIFIVGLTGVLTFNLLVESMLERQAGIIFITWLISLLVSARSMIKSMK